MTGCERGNRLLSNDLQQERQIADGTRDGARVIEAGGERIDAFQWNEPERWLSTQWPGKGTPHGAVLLVKGAGFTDEIPRNGDFGLFRLLSAGGIKPVGGGGDGVLLASWNLTRSGEPPVTIQFKPAKGAHPFARDFFTRMKCPPEVTTAPSPAAGARAP